jgi:hypothetical protein
MIAQSQDNARNGSMFPLYSMPFFHIQAGETQQISGADSIIYAPLVHKSQQGAWEDYATNHQEWIQEGLTYRGVNVKENDPGSIPTKVYSSLEQGETAPDDSDAAA